MKKSLMEQLRPTLAEGVAFIRSKESAQGSAGTTLQTALVEAIYALDSSQVDPVATYTPGTPQYEEGVSRSRLGKLQRLQSLRNMLLGDGTNPGAIQQIRDSAQTS